MGVFGDWAEKYFDLDINVVPIAENKMPPKGMTYYQWNKNKQTEDDVSLLIRKYGHCPGIAVICGEVSGICGLDFDYKYDAKKMAISEKEWLRDKNFLDNEFRSYLPDWTLAKMAIEGWTVFFKNKPEYKSLAVDRNKVRLFDFKASGYIVIPPSLHSTNNGMKYYKWIVGDPMEEFGNLPELDYSLILDFAQRFGTKNGAATFNHRHGRVFLHGKSLAKIETDPKKIAHELISYDAIVNANDPKGLYFKDHSHVGNNPVDYATKWAERLINYAKDKDDNSNPLAKTELYDYFFLNKIPYGKPKKDILTRKIFYKHPTEGTWAQGDELISSIKSYGRHAGLSVNSIQIEFERFQEEYKAKDFLTDIPAYDGKDYLKSHVEALKSDLFSFEELYEIFQHWGYGLMARIDNSEYQNRCLIIKGTQGLGKDDWIKAMVQDFKPYYQQIDVSKDPVEMISAVQKIFVAHLSEFDQTKKLDIAFLKALITNSSSFIREKYGRVAMARPMRASWITTVNIENMLRDSTGNRRFIVIPITAIDWSYKKVGLMIISQFAYNYKNNIGRHINDSTEAKIKKLIDELTPDSLDEEIEAVFLDRLKHMGSNHSTINGLPPFAVLSVNMADPISDIARKFQVSINRVYAVAKKYKRKSGDARYYLELKK